MVTADHINIRNGGTMTISSSGKLTLTNASSTRSRINGTLQIGAGTLYIDSNHTIRGDDNGDIHMTSYSALIESAPNATLTIDGVGATEATALTIHGYGEIKAKLMNKAFVVADEDEEYLNLTTYDKEATSTGRWIARGGPEATLYVQASCVVTGAGTWLLIDESDTSEIQGRIWVDPCLDDLSGDVLITNGELCLLGNFCTTGDFTLRSTGSPPSQPHVHAKKSAIAQFHVSSSGSCVGCD